MLAKEKAEEEKLRERTLAFSKWSQVNGWVYHPQFDVYCKQDGGTFNPYHLYQMFLNQ